MKVIFFSINFLYSIFFCNAQLSPQLLNIAGQSISNTNYMFDVSIGEPIITTMSSPNHLATQGFLQPDYSLINGIEKKEGTLFFNVFPNPFIEEIYLETSFTFYTIQIIDISGRYVFTSKSMTNKINLSHLSPGIYYVLLLNTNGSIVNNFKINKLNF